MFQEVELDSDQCSLTVISTQTRALQALAALLPAVDRELQDVECVITSSRQPTDAQEKMLCTKLGHLINTLHELVETALSQSAQLEALLKHLTRLYNLLSRLVKLVRHLTRLYNLLSRLVKLVRHLTRLYNLLPKLVILVHACQVSRLFSRLTKTRRQLCFRTCRSTRQPTAA